MSEHHFETRQLHAGQEPDEHGALMTPIYANSTYEYDSPADLRSEYRYSRIDGPTRADLEASVADLHGGSYGRAFSSGMGAINNVFTLLSAGDHVVAGNSLYAETHKLLTDVFMTYDVDVTFVDITDAANVENAIRPETALVYLETPTNPLLRVADIEAVAAIAEADDALFAVDNTFSSPYLQRPLELGADVVIDSLTKYMGGHSDVIAGSVVTDDEELDDQLGFYQQTLGATPSPFDCFLVLRGIKTLGARMERHCHNARTIAAFLDDHPAVREVYYPGLDSHPNHAIAARQMADFGGMVSFELDGTTEEGSTLVSNTEVFTLAESLGGVESLIEQPAVMTHQGLSREERLEGGVTDSLIRMSVGIEHPDDLVADLEGAIDAAFE